MLVNVHEPARRSSSYELKVFAKGIQQSGASKHTSTVPKDVQGKNCPTQMDQICRGKERERESEGWMDGWMGGWMNG